MSDQVVVTGMAIWSPYGRGLDAFWAGLTSGATGRCPISRFPVDHPVYRTSSAATIQEIGADEEGSAELGALQMLRETVADVLAAGALPCDDIPAYDLAVCLGSSQSVTRSLLKYLTARRAGDPDPPVPREYSPLGAGSLLAEVAEATGARGPSLMVSTACASGTSSIGVAYDMIRQGRARRAIAGGIGYYSEITLSGFNILRLTGREGCRPFDVRRDGMMLGDAFALVVLEEEELARKRGAAIQARILGYACGNEAFHPTSPSPDGGAAFEVMWQALNGSHELLDRLDYVNAHGTGTLVNDTAELVAIRRLVQMRSAPRRVAVSSTKGHLGHSLGAAGSVEFVATVIALQRGMLPPTLGLEELEPGFEEIDLICGDARAQTARLALSNSFAFGGNCASIAIAAA